MEDTESDDDPRSIDHGGYEHQFASGSLTRPVCGAVLAAVTVVLACLHAMTKKTALSSPMIYPIISAMPARADRLVVGGGSYHCAGIGIGASLRGLLR
jgi:hypothetical protein